MWSGFGNSWVRNAVRASKLSFADDVKGRSGCYESWITLSIKIARKPYTIGSLGPKALKYESFEGKGKTTRCCEFLSATLLSGFVTTHQKLRTGAH